MNKEIILVRPHVAKFIAWHEKTPDVPRIVLSKFSTITAYTSVLLATSQKAFRDESDLPLNYSAKVEVIIDIPSLVQAQRFFITNYATKAIDNFCHRLFLELAALQMDAAPSYNQTRKEARLAYLQRLDLTPDEFDEDSVRRLVDFSREDAPRIQRQMPRVSNDAVIGHLLKKTKTPKSEAGLSVLSLFPCCE